MQHSDGKRRRIDLAPDINRLTGRAYSQRYHDILSTRRKLPVFDFRQRLLDEVEANQVVVLQGETGSGKTTQVPQFLFQAGYGKVACTQPRRVAAISVAKRVAQEMDVQLGEHVGYSVRFDDVSSEATQVKYMTDGMLLREAMHDNQLSGYNAVVLDEAHERTLSTDVLMGLLKQLLPKRPGFKVIVMSATIDAHRFETYFNAPCLSVPGRLFPVDVVYSREPEMDYVKAAIAKVISICQTQPPGDVLLFLTGEDEIEESVRTIDMELSSHARSIGEVRVLPLYGSLPTYRQQAVFDPAPPAAYQGGPPGRKVIIATNIAETSLTIDGVVYVVDPGFSKQNIYNPRARVQSLLVQPISKASAKQRSGRAGRTRPGKCFRLYTSESFENDLKEATYPEILTSNLGNVVLQLKMLGIDDLVHFDFMDPPAPESLMRALELLNYLGAIDDEGELTGFGGKMSQLPVEPESAAVLLKSQEFGCSNEIVTIVSMLSTGNNFFERRKRGRKGSKGSRGESAKKRFEHTDGDHLTLLNVFHAYENACERGDETRYCRENELNNRALGHAKEVRRQLSRTMRRHGNGEMGRSNMDDVTLSSRIRRALLSGYFMQVAHREYKSFCTVKDDQMVHLHPSSGIKGRTGEWVMYHEFVLTKDQFIRTVSSVKAEWLMELAGHYYDLSNFPDGEAKRALMYVQNRIRKKVKKKESREEEE